MTFHLPAGGTPGGTSEAAGGTQGGTSEAVGYTVVFEALAICGEYFIVFHSYISYIIVIESTD